MEEIEYCMNFIMLFAWKRFWSETIAENGHLFEQKKFEQIVEASRKIFKSDIEAKDFVFSFLNGGKQKKKNEINHMIERGTNTNELISYCKKAKKSLVEKDIFMAYFKKLKE